MKNFYHLLANTLIASITNMSVWFAIIFYVYLQTNSVMATSIMSGIYSTAVASSGIWFGSLVDHYKKKYVMMASSFVSLLLFSVGFGVYLTTAPEEFTQITSVRLWVLIPILLFGVVVGNIRTIALPTLVTLLVAEKKRDKANGLVGTTSGIAFTITSVISGFLVSLGGMFYVMILAIAMTLLSILHLWLVPIVEKKIVHLQKGKSKIDMAGTLKAIFKISGLAALILFTTFNNFLGGVFMSLMDAYALSMVSVEVWGLLLGLISTAFIMGGMMIAKFGLGKNPLLALFTANIIMWIICCFFTIYPSVILLVAGMYAYLCVVPYIEASEHTIIQKVVPVERQGRVFGFAQSVEQAASPITAFAIGPIAQYLFIPFMTTGAGVELIGWWFGTGHDRGIALVFTVTGIIGLCMTLIAFNSKQYRVLSQQYLSK
ncbi:MAG TPA: MFS transporter [Vitreimonas sp.]|nr:MFS transporter [Vitreimonas sp.]